MAKKTRVSGSLTINDPCRHRVLSSKVIMAPRDRTIRNEFRGKAVSKIKALEMGGKSSTMNGTNGEKNMGNCGEAPALASSRKGLI